MNINRRELLGSLAAAAVFPAPPALSIARASTPSPGHDISEEE